MDEFLFRFFENIITAPVLAFALGMLAARLKSDLRFPDAFYQALSIYLMFSIGLKGGTAISKSSVNELIPPAILGLFICFFKTYISFYLVRKIGKIDRVNAAGMAAHYGSVSVVTFIAAADFLLRHGISPEGYMPGIVAIMEVPGIIIAIFLGQSSNAKKATRTILTSKSVILLLGGMIIGGVIGESGMKSVKIVYVDLFTGMLTLFLLELGVVAGQRLNELRKVGFFLPAFAIFVPLIFGLIGVLLAKLIGMSMGGAMLMGVLSGSSSYIAAPLAVRAAYPESNPAIFLNASLGCTFPISLAFGIPINYAFAELLFR